MALIKCYQYLEESIEMWITLISLFNEFVQTVTYLKFRYNTTRQEPILFVTFYVSQALEGAELVE